jgi:methionine--tRNA ligase beta chain
MDSFKSWLDEIHRAGVNLPIVVGVMPVLNVEKCIRYCVSMNGSAIPRSLARVISRYYYDPEGFREAGMDYTVQQMYEYLQLGVNGIHVYTLNQYKDVEEILKKTADITEKQRQEFVESQKTARENLVKAGKMSREEADRLNAADGGSEADAGEVIDIEAKPEIGFDDFGAMQFQVGIVKSCEAVEKSKKLLCSQVQVGSRTLQIVSGIRKYYSPEDMVGKQVMVLVNLKPAKLAGVLSEGMLLCAEDADGNLALMTPDKSMPAGAEIC